VKREFGYVAGELKRQRPEHSAYTVYDNDTSSEDIRDAVSNAQNLEGVAYFAFVSINIDSALSTKSSVFLSIQSPESIRELLKRFYRLNGEGKKGYEKSVGCSATKIFFRENDFQVPVELHMSRPELNRIGVVLDSKEIVEPVCLNISEAILFQKDLTNPIDGIFLNLSDAHIKDDFGAAKDYDYRSLNAKEMNEVLAILKENPGLRFYIYDSSLENNILRVLENQQGVEFLTTCIRNNQITKADIESITAYKEDPHRPSRDNSLGRLKAEIFTKITENNFFLADQSRKPSIKEVFQMLFYFWGGGKSKGEEEQFIKRFLSENSNFANGFKELIEEFQEKIKTTLLVDYFGCQRFFNEFLKEQLFREIEKEQLFREIELTKSPKLEEGEAEWHYSFIEVYKRLILSLENSEKTYEEVQRKLIERMIKIVHAYQFLDDVTAMVVEEEEKAISAARRRQGEGLQEEGKGVKRAMTERQARPVASPKALGAENFWSDSRIPTRIYLNDIRVVDEVYPQTEDGQDPEETMLGIIMIAMTELKMSLNDVRDAIKIAKHDRDIANEIEPDGSRYIPDIKLGRDIPGVTQLSEEEEKALKLKDFSRIFQRKCRDCGIFTAHEGLSVGLRLTFLPQTTSDALRLLESEDALEIANGLVEAKTAAVKLLVDKINKSQPQR